MDAPAHPAPDATPAPARPIRVFVGGFLMGFANLVPGLSGGTMILVAGLYDAFVGAVADLTRLRWSRSLFMFLAVLAAGLAIAVLGLSGPAVWSVTHHRWVMYSLFIGMTLSAVPDLIRLCGGIGAGELVAAALGLALMVALRYTGGAWPQNGATLFAIGVLGASSMILPGISGSYILLIFGFYDVVIGSLRPEALLDDTREALWVVVPFAAGVGVGIAALSNVLKYLLTRFAGPSHAALLGLVLGSVLGLWPFEEPRHPELADRASRKAIEALAAGEEVDLDAVGWSPADRDAYAARFGGGSPGDLKARALEADRFDPTGLQIALALSILLAGYGATRAFARLGRRAET